MIFTIALAVLVPYFNDFSYTRNEPLSPPWFVWNNKQPSKLYYNGVYQAEESGTNDLNMFGAWNIQSKGAKVGVLSDGVHGQRVTECVRAISPYSEIYTTPIPRWYADSVAPAILACLSQNCKVIVVPGGYGESSSFLRYVLENGNAIFIFSASNTTENLDMEVNYPYSWNNPKVLVVNSTDRNGNWYWSATGTNCVAVPGRNIVAAGTYSSGTSYSAPIVAGVVALVWQKNPGWRAEEVVSTIHATSIVNGSINRVNPVPALQFTRYGK